MTMPHRATETLAFVDAYAARYRDLFRDVHSFDPRRWETLSPSAYAYNPFSAGPRMCIGATFALLEIRLVLAMLLQRFRLQYQTQTPVERFGTIVLGPKHGMPMQVHLQDRQVGVGVGGVRGNIRELVQLPA